LIGDGIVKPRSSAHSQDKSSTQRDLQDEKLADRGGIEVILIDHIGNSGQIRSRTARRVDGSDDPANIYLMQRWLVFIVPLPAVFARLMQESASSLYVSNRRLSIKIRIVAFDTIFRSLVLRLFVLAHFFPISHTLNIHPYM
jgi:hypothetical protein